MVKAELTYNPYLLETSVRFNNHPPRINSLVEKYQDGRLQDWVHMLPQIFYDEMNGYDFELEFSGTSRDFLEVKKAFTDAGVGEDQVLIFHKNELDDRKAKLCNIRQLLQWLEEHRNHHFDEYEKLKEEQEDLFKPSYSCILYKGNDDEIAGFQELYISAEVINNTNELEDTDLTNIPILFYADRNSWQEIRKDLQYFLAREDTDQKQLFFVLDPSLNREIAERTIIDLGVKKPTIVESAEDDQILRFMELYPVSDYIGQVISVFQEQTDRLRDTMKQISQINAVQNRNTREQIDCLNESIDRLKKVLNLFVDRDNLEMQPSWTALNAELISKIQHWRKNKVKIVKEDEARCVAAELDESVRAYFKAYQTALMEKVYLTMQDMESEMQDFYKQANYDTAYHVPELTLAAIPDIEVPSIREDLLKLNTVVLTKPKEDFFNIFKVSVQKDNDIYLNSETTYYYEKWREYALETILPLAQEFLQDRFKAVDQYYNDLANEYIVHMKELIRDRSHHLDLILLQQSDDVRMQEADKQWLETFTDQLEDIKRR